MSNLLFQAETFVSARALPTLSNIEDLLYIEKYEMDAYGHWIFDNQSPLLSKSNAATLTVQAGATIQPDYLSNHLGLTGTMGNALMTGLQDTTGTFTMIVLMQPSVTSLIVGAGTLSVPNGAGIFTSANKGLITVRGGSASLTTSLTFDPAKPVLIALSSNNASSVVSLLTMQNGLTQTATGTTGTYVPSSTAIGIGNTRYATSGLDAVRTKFYEAIVYNKALTMAELQAVAARSKVRMLNRGITF